MTLVEFLVVAFGLWGGYWLVSKILVRKDTPGDDRNANSRDSFDKSRAGCEGSKNDAWHHILNVPATASMDEIRHSYKTLMSQYHPDKVDALGNELKELAERKSKEITQAYRDASRLRG